MLSLLCSCELTVGWAFGVGGTRCAQMEALNLLSREGGPCLGPSDSVLFLHMCKLCACRSGDYQWRPLDSTDLSKVLDI